MTNNGWRRSSKCSMGNCVEIRVTDERVFVRDSKQSVEAEAQPQIDIDHRTWRIFLDEIRGSEPTGSNGILATHALTEGVVELIDTSTGISLFYHSEEWRDFVGGVELGEMAPPLVV